MPFGIQSQRERDKGLQLRGFICSAEASPEPPRPSRRHWPLKLVQTSSRRCLSLEPGPDSGWPRMGW